jgi:hypothetical protein
MGSTNIISNTAQQPYKTTPFPGGANSIHTAGIVQQQNQNTAQNNLISGTGGGKRRIKRGGAAQGPPQVQVSTLPSYTPNAGPANTTNTQIASLAVNTQNNAAYDKTVNGNQAQVAAINANQQAVYNKTGGSRKYKKGGSWPIWGCLSGGKKSKRNKRKCKKRKTRKYRRHRR